MGESLPLVVLGAGMADRDHLDKGLIPNLVVLAEQQGKASRLGSARRRCLSSGNIPWGKRMRTAVMAQSFPRLSLMR